MRFSNFVPSPTCACLVLGCLAARASAYFMISQPTVGSSWTNGEANFLSWTKGVLDDIDTFDIEMTRLSQDGLTFVAKDVPATKDKSLNIFLQDVPPGDDYFLLFINSTHGLMYSTSSRFTILPSGTQANATQPSVDGAAPTVTVSGSPNPTAAFATTFPPASNAAVAFRRGLGLRDWSTSLITMTTVLGGCAAGAAWTLW